MIRLMFKVFIYFLIILFLFAIIPEKFWQWLKPYFNWEVLLKTIKKGWENFFRFIKESTGINFDNFFITIKEYTGIDFYKISEFFKNLIANFFLKLYNLFK